MPRRSQFFFLQNNLSIFFFWFPRSSAPVERIVSKGIFIFIDIRAQVLVFFGGGRKLHCSTSDRNNILIALCFSLFDECPALVVFRSQRRERYTTRRRDSLN